MEKDFCKEVIKSKDHKENMVQLMTPKLTIYVFVRYYINNGGRYLGCEQPIKG